MDRLAEASALLTVTAPTTPLHATLTALIVIARCSGVCRSAMLLKASEALRAMATCAGENKGRVEQRRYPLSRCVECRVREADRRRSGSPRRSGRQAFRWRGLDRAASRAR